MDAISRLLKPRSVAVVGASADPAKHASRAQRLLALQGFRGRVLPVNPGRSEIQGLPAYPDIGAAPGPVDHAVIMLPTGRVREAVARAVTCPFGSDRPTSIAARPRVLSICWVEVRRSVAREATIDENVCS